MNRIELLESVSQIFNRDNGYFGGYEITDIIDVVDEYVEHLLQNKESSPVDVTWILTPNSSIQQAIKLAGIVSVKFNREVSFIFNGVVMELEHFNHVDEIDGWLIESVTNIYKERLFKLYSTLK